MSHYYNVETLFLRSIDACPNPQAFQRLLDCSRLFSGEDQNLKTWDLLGKRQALLDFTTHPARDIGCIRTTQSRGNFTQVLGCDLSDQLRAGRVIGPNSFFQASQQDALGMQFPRQVLEQIFRREDGAAASDVEDYVSMDDRHKSSPQRCLKRG